MRRACPLMVSLSNHMSGPDYLSPSLPACRLREYNEAATPDNHLGWATVTYGIMKKALLSDDVNLLQWRLPSVPDPLPRAVLIVVSGLPGTGKSYFSRRLAERLPIAVVETDVMRRVLFPEPDYSAKESARLFRACHALIEEMLRRCIPVLLDATNLVEANRERLYNIAHRASAKLILVRVEAPPGVVAQRLGQREQGAADPEDVSTAGRSVYDRMATSVEPIRRNHLAVDTSRDITPVMEKIEREIQRWVKV